MIDYLKQTARCNGMDATVVSTDRERTGRTTGFISSFLLEKDLALLYRLFCQVCITLVEFTHRLLAIGLA